MIHNQEHPVLEEEEQIIIPLSKTNNNVSDVKDEDVFFAKERFKLHQATPGEGVSIEILKKYFFKKYGF